MLFILTSRKKEMKTRVKGIFSDIFLNLDNGKQFKFNLAHIFDFDTRGVNLARGRWRFPNNRHALDSVSLS